MFIRFEIFLVNLPKMLRMMANVIKRWKRSFKMPPTPKAWQD